MACVGQTPGTWGPPMGYIQGSEMRAKWVLVGSNAMQRHPVRSGSYELLVWLGNQGIRLAGGSLHFMMSRVIADDDPVHLGFDTWGITGTSIAW